MALTILAFAITAIVMFAAFGALIITFVRAVYVAAQNPPNEPTDDGADGDECRSGWEVE